MLGLESGKDGQSSQPQDGVCRGKWDEGEPRVQFPCPYRSPPPSHSLCLWERPRIRLDRGDRALPLAQPGAAAGVAISYQLLAQS